MNELFLELYDSSIQMIKSIERLSIAYNKLDSQEYLLWKDTLNSLSMDPDRI